MKQIEEKKLIDVMGGLHDGTKVHDAGAIIYIPNKLSTKLTRTDIVDGDIVPPNLDARVTFSTYHKRRHRQWGWVYLHETLI